MSLNRLKEDFGERARFFRESEGWTQEYFAELIGVEVAVIRNIEAGTYEITHSQNRQIFFKISFAFRMGSLEFKILHELCRIRAERKWKYKRLLRRSNVSPRKLSKLRRRF